jgi:hypothetical protein
MEKVTEPEKYIRQQGSKYLSTQTKAVYLQSWALDDVKSQDGDDVHEGLGGGRINTVPDVPVNAEAGNDVGVDTFMAMENEDSACFQIVSTSSDGTVSKRR